jgi:hypothetical protein
VRHKRTTCSASGRKEKSQRHIKISVPTHDWFIRKEFHQAQIKIVILERGYFPSRSAKKLPFAFISGRCYFASFTSTPFGAVLAQGTRHVCRKREVRKQDFLPDDKLDSRRPRVAIF